MTDNWVLEWSKRQNAFHIQEEQRAVEKNLNNLLNNEGSDYITLCIGSRTKCDRAADKYRHYLMDREIATFGK
tara:strand:- start:57 stop:275 length:219 start_codon:yes stop_codon:yes gene_type:complete